MQKIKRASHILFLLFQALCWLIPIFTAYMTFFHIDVMIQYGFFDKIISVSSIQSTEFSLSHRAILFVIEMLPNMITIAICHQLAQLFRLYGQGSLFELDNIKRIKHISILMLVGELIQLIYQPLITIALSFNNPVGQRFISISLGSTNMSTVTTAFIILIASWIVNEAHQLKSDAQLTI